MTRVVVGVMKVKMRASWVHLLKEKRMEVKSIVSKVRNKFNVSVAEVQDQDVHQTIVIGISCVSTSQSHANSILDGVLNYIESSFEPEIVDYDMEMV